MRFRLYFALHNTPMANDMTFGQWDWNARPLNILCSFALKGALRSWKNRQYETPGVKTILDSGAYSAWKSGTDVDYDDFILEAIEEGWDEVAALDVIGDPVSSQACAFDMKVQHHIDTLPVFHYGEPWEYLAKYKEHFNSRVAIGGIAGIGKQQKIKFVGQCFARAYPCSFHGFGVGDEDVLMEFPFASADTASWGSVHMYGRSMAAPGLKIPKLEDGDRNKHYDLRFEVAAFCEMEDRVRDRWSNELQKLESLLNPLSSGAVAKTQKSS